MCRKKMKLLFIGNFKGGHFQLLSEKTDYTRLTNYKKKRSALTNNDDCYIKEKQAKIFTMDDSTIVVKEITTDTSKNDFNEENNFKNNEKHNQIIHSILDREVNSYESESNNDNMYCKEITKYNETKTYEIIPVKTDTKSLYRCLAFLEYGDEELYDKIEKGIISYGQDNWDSI